MIDSQSLNLMQRITIPEIKQHPWFLKNIPVEFMEENNLQSSNQNHEQQSSQSIEEILVIIQEARKAANGAKIGGLLLGSMDLDEIDDADIDDIETSGDFVCAL